MTGAPFFVLLAVLQQQPQAASTVEELPADAPSGGPAASAPATGGSGEGDGVGFMASLEVGPLSFPSGPRGGGQDLFVTVSPQLGVDGGEDFELVLGAPLRLRLLDEDPQQKANDFGANLRREDWDERSDYGQVVRKLRLGTEASRFSVRVGPLVEETLGYGHLVGRYTNTLNPDYHPAGGHLAFNLGATQVQLLASDVLDARLFAGEVRLDIGRLSSEDAKHFDRYHAIVSVAHDFGKAGGETPTLTAVQLGGDAALHKGEKLQLFAMLSGGARVDVGTEDPSAGGAVGLSIRGQPSEDLDISGRLEGRYQGGSFRFGLFGAGYELSRFSATGLAEVPLADERLERHFSGFGEVSVAMGEGRDDALELVGSVGGEYFSFGRVDADLALRFQLPGGKAGGITRVVITGLMDKPRYAVSVTGTYRFLPAVYAWAGGGTVHFPQPDGHLARGVTVGAGVGVDFQR